MLNEIKTRGDWPRFLEKRRGVGLADPCDGGRRGGERFWKKHTSIYGKETYASELFPFAIREPMAKTQPEEKEREDRRDEIPRLEPGAGKASRRLPGRGARGAGWAGRAGHAVHSEAREEGRPVPAPPVQPSGWAELGGRDAEEGGAPLGSTGAAVAVLGGHTVGRRERTLGVSEKGAVSLGLKRCNGNGGGGSTKKQRRRRCRRAGLGLGGWASHSQGSQCFEVYLPSF